MKFLPTTVAAITTGVIGVPAIFAEAARSTINDETTIRKDDKDFESKKKIGRRVSNNAMKKRRELKKSKKSSGKGGKGKGSDFAITKCFFNSLELFAPTQETCEELVTQAGLSDDTKIKTGSCIDADTGVLGLYGCQSFTGEVKIGSDSCIGGPACNVLSETKVGDDSCVGYYSCDSISDSTIGDCSCSGSGYSPGADNKGACATIDNTNIGDGSCKGGFENCHNIYDSEIGSSSCVGYYRTCQMMTENTIGDRACIGFSSCTSTSFLTVDDSSCIGYLTCASNYGTQDEEIVIGRNSCVGKYACGLLPPGVEIGDGSCIGYLACDQITFEVGDNSCVGDSDGTYGACTCAEAANFLDSDGKMPDNTCNPDNCCCNCPP